MTERTFRISDAASASGLSVDAIAQMIHRHRFAPARNPRAGVARDFTLRDIVHLAAIADLQAAGLSLVHIMSIIGPSAEGTAGQDIVRWRHGDTEIAINMANVAERVRVALGLDCA